MSSKGNSNSKSKSKSKSRLRIADIAAFLPFTIICLCYLDFIPIWDAREYADCIAKAAQPGGHFPTSYGCAQHPTVAYVVVTSLLAQFIHGRYWPILLMNIALGVFALSQFLGLMRELFPERELDARLLTACLGVYPVFLSSAVSVNPDFGVTAFFLALLLALLRKQFLLAALYSVLLTFCKEPGILLAFAAIGAHALLFTIWGEGKGRDKLRSLTCYLPALVCAPLLFAWMRWGPHTGAQLLWKGNGARDVVKMLFTFSATDQLFLAQLVCIFLLQFTWVIALPICFRWINNVQHFLRRKPSTDSLPLYYLDLLLIASVYLLTRPQTFLNPRYFLPLIPLLLLSAYAAIRRMHHPVRAALTGLVALLFLGSAFRTIDPVSRDLFGTFAFGEHPMLRMTTLTYECCGLGRDQLAYNLQHTQLHYLQNDLYKAIAPGAGRGLAADEHANWWLVGSIDAKSRERTMDREGSEKPHLFDAAELDANSMARPKTLFWIDFPNLPNESAKASIAAWYQPMGTQKVTRGGYALVATEYRLRDK